ncbi:MAG: hypothetical protein ACO38P_10370, partial [Phycisphaerales bacterium]
MHADEVNHLSPRDDARCLMDFLHLGEAIDLRRLASVIRPFVEADFEFHQDQFVECMVATWGGHEVVVSHP